MDSKKQNINEVTYTTNDLIRLFGRSKQRYEQLRRGHFNNKIKKEKVTLYKVEPYLIQGTDWHKSYGHVVYTESAIEKLKKKFK